MKIGYLGPEGSFSNEAALKIFKENQLVACSSFELIRSLQEGTIQGAVLPIENSTEGSVNWVFNFLLENNLPFQINGEIILSIEHNLIGFGELKNIKTVLSHPQALAQCSKLLTLHKIVIKNTDSTSEAVSLAAADKNITAIGTKRAAEIYNVPIILSNINDNYNNQTRFIVLRPTLGSRTGKDKTSFVFETEDKPGALLRVLEVFDVFEINMTMIISRPSKKGLGTYMFFVDVEGHQEDEHLKTAFGLIKEKLGSLKILGSYPVGQIA